MRPLCLMFIWLAAMPALANQTALLKTFRKEFVEITPGKAKFPKSFQMGSQLDSESPRHKVTFDYTFSIAKYEVPQNLWMAVTGKNPSRWKGERNSVERLSFHDAEKFCVEATKLMRKAKLIRGDEEIRLPSEAEWEYVARAGTTTQYSFGDDLSKLDAHAWSTRNAAGNDPAVGERKPNPWGLYDIHGYLWEWCSDVAHEDYEGAPQDGSPWMAGGEPTKRVLRGGSWKNEADRLTSSYRILVPRTVQDDAIGLRCVLAKVRPIGKPSTGRSGAAD